MIFAADLAQSPILFACKIHTVVDAEMVKLTKIQYAIISIRVIFNAFE
ncbi:hypothetical protein AABM17_916 [Neisseria musculi]|uniref:Uncharacterized protein n=1 Tax=Neisseria musculi TaxID=1815583 RepID=A0A7H1MD93_9NEIS|nr:hypothetical protein H7A79_0916 [Neisseria musculi]